MDHHVFYFAGVDVGGLGGGDVGCVGGLHFGAEGLVGGRGASGGVIFGDFGVVIWDGMPGVKAICTSHVIRIEGS